MTTTTEVDAKILSVFKILKRTMIKYGKFVSFPDDTDPKKTYNWRYISNFIIKLEAYGLHENFYPQIITAIVEHARRKNLLKRGIAVLLRTDLLELAIKRLEQDCKKEIQTFETIRRSYQLVYDQTEPEQLYYKTLLKKQVRNGYTDIVRWFLAGNIAMDYIVVSRSARIALGSLSPIERSNFPDAKTLLRMRVKILSHEELIRKLRETLQEDLFEE